MKNPYEVLGVPTNASIAEIKSAFRSLAKATHPDVNGGNPELTAKFRDVAEAYAVLSDPEKKNTWDKYYQDRVFQKTKFNSSSFYDSSVRATAVNIERYIHALYEEVRPYKEAAKKSVAVGMAWLIGGLVVTLGSYSSAVKNGGGTYVVAWGAIVFGGIQAVKSFYNYVRINNAVAEAEVKMWDALK
ncbi:MAG: J domain-containing protein [Tissierellia bacterium]|jgi:curved DNA-binding protein CbpA|nr:J domain-containing protein [Tissierellia bacterium]NLL06447.1 J domain-containing protein [Clostridiaceae bacterium]